MESAIKNTRSTGLGVSPHSEDVASEHSFAERRRQLTIGILRLNRDQISTVDTANKESWQLIIAALLDGGFTESELEIELAASPNTIYKWKTGLAAPREMTRRLLRKAVLELIDDRIRSVEATQ